MTWVLLLNFVDCSYNNAYIKNPKKNISQKKEILNEHKLIHRLFLVGDGGKSDSILSQHLTLTKYIRKNPNKSSVVFLGDNVYEHGLPEKSRMQSEYNLFLNRLKIQIDAAVQGQPKNIIFLPGNHDWDKQGKFGLNNILTQQIQINKLSHGKAMLQPRFGCADFQTLNISNAIQLIFLDSQRIIDLLNHKNPILQNENSLLKKQNPEIMAQLNQCKMNDANVLKRELTKLLNLAKKEKKNVIVMAHHPLESTGGHGGYFDYPHHIFPVYNYNKYVPLPIIASLIVFMRQFGWLTSTDIANSKYQKYIEFITPILKNKIFAYTAGHEHNIQLATRKDFPYHIVSGSFSKKDTAMKSNNSLFSWEKISFSSISFWQNGKITFEVYNVNSKSILYQTKLK